MALGEFGLSLLPGALVATYDRLWGVSLMLLGVSLLLLIHLRHLDALVRWLRGPDEAPVPYARGLWDRVFSDLNRQARRLNGERRQLAAALEGFREAGQAMPDGMLYLGKANTIEWANHRAEEHFGIDARRDRGAPVTNLARTPDFVSYLESGRYAEALVMRPVRLPRQTLLVQVVPYADHKKMVLSRDISQLERLETMRRDFVANVSHELRTPLTVVLGFLETLADGIDDLSREDQLRFIGLASEQAERMHRLIQDLLVLSALETGAPAPVEERVPVAELMSALAREAESLSRGQHEIVLELASHRDDILLRSAKELHSAFSNLLSNAVRYSGDNGRITMRWTRSNGDGVFSVEDQGIGIDPVHLPRLTERFYRVDRGRSRESGGTGLGLAIVKHVLTRHQASLEIESELGRGSTFRVRLPARRVVTSAGDEAV